MLLLPFAIFVLLRGLAVRLLIVNYYYSPMTDAHAYRWAQLVDYIAEARPSIEVDVLTSKIRGIEDKSELGTVNISRVGLVPYKLGDSSEITGAPDKSGFINRTASSIKECLRKIYRRFYWPDGLWHWMPALLVALKNKPSGSYDLVISYSPTFSSHLAVLAMAKHLLVPSTGKWIADYGDPFAISETMQPNNFAFYRVLNHALEQKIINSADAVVFTNSATHDAYLETYNLANKSRVIPHMVNEELFFSPSCRSPQQKKINIVYVGALHKAIREPWVALEKLSKAFVILQHFGYEPAFNLYGPTNGIDLTRYVAGAIQWHGKVDREKAIEIMKGADVLVNIENMNCIMSPSKIVEYVATGKPIINISNSGSADSELIRKCIDEGRAMNFHADSDCRWIADSLITILSSVDLTLEEVKALIGPYSINAVMKAYLGE
jgi:glycosyltransferase involved in cell wall biosynthesis